MGQQLDLTVTDTVLGSILRWAAAIALSPLLWGRLSVAIYSTWIRGADHRDLYRWWAGIRLALFNEQDLYSQETTRPMQLELCSAPLPSDAGQQGFAYPAELLAILFPCPARPDPWCSVKDGLPERQRILAR